MQTVELSAAPEVKRLVLAAFPSYRKRGAFLSVFHPTNINSYWDGGSRDEYVLVELATAQRRALPTATHPYFDVARHVGTDLENQVVEVDRVGNITLKVLPEGIALVSAGTSCGKLATAHVRLHPDNFAKLLPQPKQSG